MSPPFWPPIRCTLITVGTIWLMLAGSHVAETAPELRSGILGMLAAALVIGVLVGWEGASKK